MITADKLAAWLAKLPKKYTSHDALVVEMPVDVLLAVIIHLRKLEEQGSQIVQPDEMSDLMDIGEGIHNG